MMNSQDSLHKISNGPRKNVLVETGLSEKGLSGKSFKWRKVWLEKVRVNLIFAPIDFLG